MLSHARRWLPALLSLASFACGGVDEDASSVEGAEDDVVSAAKATLGIDAPTSFLVAPDGLYATTAEGIVRTDPRGRKATVVPGSRGAARILSADGDQLVYAASAGSIQIIYGLPKEGGKRTELGRTRELVHSMSVDGDRLYYTWLGSQTSGSSLDVLTLDGRGTPSTTLGAIGEVKGGEAPVVVGETVFVVDGSEWQTTKRAAKIVAVERAQDEWSVRPVASVPEASGSMAERGSLVAHGDALYLAGGDGVHRVALDGARTRSGDALPTAPVLVTYDECAAARAFAVDDDGIYLACMLEDTSREVRVYGFDGKRKEALGVLREDVGSLPPEIQAFHTTADAVYVFRTMEGADNDKSYIYRFPKK